ncbi:MAG TPA: UDP-N-acetylmuramoyl-L-alanine--D-glutamate ligase [Bacteroidales bacterium]|nr:UDP-N-acetylmuramoyl-L-alanine--D-glutamate ligase [Bacteroidales bacterium]
MQKEVVVLGAGESGVAAALLLKARGIPVFVSDRGLPSAYFLAELEQAGIPYEAGGHSRSRILAAAEVVKSPGIPDELPLISQLDAAGIPVISDIELAGRYSKAHVVGITGSNGKTTTTLWLQHVLQSAGVDAVLAGNVGVSPCRTLLQRDPAVFVTELSSFQLDRMYRYRVNTAVITNITPDHLDRYHHRFEEYVAAKYRILQNQTGEDAYLWCSDDAVLRAANEQFSTAARSLPFGLEDTTPGRVEGNELVVENNGLVLRLPLAQLPLKGKHNLYNAMAVALAALELKVPVAQVVGGLTSFKGVPHRLEDCGEVDGVRYINDSKATNVNSVWYALESMTRPVVWIAGGTDKGNDYAELKELVAAKVHTLVCMGVDNRKLEKDFEAVVPRVLSTHSMEGALSAAREFARSGDAVLLSPACASFDLFRNYEHRGELFRAMVKKWME